MKIIIAIGALCLWLASLSSAEAQYRSQIDQAWKRVQAQQEKACPPSKKNDVEPSKKGQQNSDPRGRVPDRWSR